MRSELSNSGYKLTKFKKNNPQITQLNQCKINQCKINQCKINQRKCNICKMWWITTMVLNILSIIQNISQNTYLHFIPGPMLIMINLPIIFDFYYDSLLYKINNIWHMIYFRSFTYP
jgi:hypothetical protein